MKDLLLNRNAALYLVGQTVSAFGDSALWLVAAVWIVQLTGSVALAGLSFFFLVAPSVLAPFAGLLIDRVGRRPLLVVGNLASAAAVLPLLLVHDRGEVWLVYLVMALNGVSNTLLSSAQSALLPSVVEPIQIGRLNALLRSAREAMRLIAPPAGTGMFVAFGGGVVAVVDSMSFLTAAGALLLLQLRHRDRDIVVRQHIVRELAAGFRHLLSVPGLRRAVIALAVVLLVVGFLETTTLALITQGLHRPAAYIGVVQAAQGAGAVVGGVIALRVLPRLGETALAAFGAVGVGAGCGLWTLPASVTAVLAGAILLGAGLPWLIVGVDTLVQLRTPDVILGRTFGAIEVAGSLPQTISIAVGAAAIAVVPYVALIAFVAMVTVIAGLWLFLKRERGALPTE